MEELYSFFERKKIIIVGGAGFVGSNLCKLLVENVNEINVIVIDNLLSSEICNIPISDKITFIEGSITEHAVLNQIIDDVDYIFHLSTFHGNQSSIYDPIKDHENNTLTTLKLFEHIHNFKNIKKIVYSSAGCSVAKKTFDNAFATTEDSPIELSQDSPYSISKIIGEFYSVYYHKQYNLPVVRARFQNVYGPGEILGAGIWRGTYATVWRNVTPTFIYKSIKGDKLTVENNGIATRDFIFVDDICKGLMLCAIKGDTGDVYNIGSGKETSILDLAIKINNFTGNTSGIELLPKRPWDNSGKRFASIIKSKEKLGFVACTNIDDGLKITIEWTKNNINLIDNCILKHKAHMDLSKRIVLH